MARKSETFEQVPSFQKEAVDAFAEMAATSGKGFEKLQSEILLYAKSSSEAFAEAAKSMFGAGSFNAALEVQQAYAKRAFETHVVEMTKIAELFTDSMKAAMEPIVGQAAAISRKFGFKAL